MYSIHFKGCIYSETRGENKVENLWALTIYLSKSWQTFKRFRPSLTFPIKDYVTTPLPIRAHVKDGVFFRGVLFLMGTLCMSVVVSSLLTIYLNCQEKWLNTCVNSCLTNLIRKNEAITWVPLLRNSGKIRIWFIHVDLIFIQSVFIHLSFSLNSSYSNNDFYSNLFKHHSIQNYE